MSQNRICPVCKRTSASETLRCEHCSASLAFCTLFSGENAYKAWLESINLKKAEIFGKLSSELVSNGSRLSISSDNIAFCNNKTHKAVVLRFGYTSPSVYENIKQISLSKLYTVFLRTDGTLFAEGEGEYGQTRVYDLKNIVSVATAPYCTYAVSADGRVTARGISPFSEVLDSWNDIRSIVCTNECIIGIRNNGSVCATATNDSPLAEYTAQASKWTDVTKVEIGEDYIIALTKNGKVLYSGEAGTKSACTNFNHCVDIAADNNYVIGLSASGKVSLAGTTSKFTDFGRIEANGWDNMYFIAGGKYLIAGLTASGELKLAGNITDKADVSSVFSTNYRNSVTE